MFSRFETDSVHAREGVRVYFERVPEHHIDEVVINDYARYVTPKWFQDQFLTEEKIKEMTCMSVGYAEGDLSALVSPGYGRGFVAHYGHFPFYKSVGRIIKAKGCFVSGARYNKTQQELSIWGAGDPHGLFGLKHAKWETEISNELLPKDFRATLPFATVIYKESIRPWLLSRTPNRRIQEVIDASFSTLSMHKDTPVEIFHLGGTEERQDVLHPMLFHSKRQHEDIQRGAQTLLDEYHDTWADQTLMRQYVSLMDENQIVQLRLALERMSAGDLINSWQFRAYRQLLTLIYATNSYALSSVIENRFERGEASNIVPSRVSFPLDVDCSLFSTDFESARHEEVIFTDTSSYDESAVSYIHRFLMDPIAVIHCIKRNDPDELQHAESGLLTWVKPEERLKAVSENTEQQIQEEYTEMMRRVYHNNG